MEPRWTRREFLEVAATGAASVALPGAAPGAAADPPARQPLAVFSKHLQHLDYPELARTVSGAGYDAIDLTVRPGGHVLPERVREDLPRAVEAARAAGVTIPMITTAITSADEPHARAVLETASRLGVRDYRLGYIDYDASRGVAGTLEALRSPLKGLAALNEACGIRGGYQNHAGDRLGAAVWDLWLVLREVGSPWLGCQYDVRHAVIEGFNAWRNALRLIAPFVHTLDVKDGRWERGPKGWRATTVPIGEGAVDFVAFFTLLGGLGLRKPISVHFEYPFPETGAPAERRRAAIALMRTDRERLLGAMTTAGYGARS